MATTTVETGTGTTSTVNDSVFTHTKRDAGGTFEVKLKDLKHTSAGDAFFTSPRVSIGPHVCELSLSFDRTFACLRRLGHREWRGNLRASLLSLWSLCFCVWELAGAVCAAYETGCDDFLNFNCCPSYTVFGKKREITIRGIYSWWVRRWMTTYPSSSEYIVGLFFTLLGPVVIVGWAIVIASLCILGLVYFCFSALVWFACYYVTMPFWYQNDYISSTLKLLSNEQMCVEHRATVHHKTRQVLNKTGSQTKTLQVNEISEVKGFADVQSCSKPKCGFCSDGWLTIVVDIDLKGPVSKAQVNKDIAQIMEEGEMVDLPDVK